MIEEMKMFAQSKNICVLATVSEGKPHCSLMAYATNRNCEKIYMATSRNTRKFANILANPHVSILIDSREIKPRSQAKALTVEGTCSIIAEKETKAKAEKILSEKLPHLHEILDKPDAEILSVRVESFLLLEGLTREHFEKLGD